MVSRHALSPNSFDAAYMHAGALQPVLSIWLSHFALHHHHHHQIHAHTCLLVSCSMYFAVSTASTAPGAATFCSSCSLSIKCTCLCPTVMAENMPAYLLRLSSNFLMSPVRKCILTCLHLSVMAAFNASDCACSCADACKAYLCLKMVNMCSTSAMTTV